MIVAGISVSFWLNEISIGNQNEKERIKVLNSLNMEVDEIQSYCDERVNRWNKDRRILMMFLSLVVKILMLTRSLKSQRVKVA